MHTTQSVTDWCVLNGEKFLVCSNFICVFSDSVVDVFGFV